MQGCPQYHVLHARLHSSSHGHSQAERMQRLRRVEKVVDQQQLDGHGADRTHRSPIWTWLGDFRTEFGRTWPSSASLADLVPGWPTLSDFTEFGQMFAMSGQLFARSTKFRTKSTKLGQIRPNVPVFGQIRALFDPFGRLRPNLANLDQSGTIRPNSTGFDQLWPVSAKSPSVSANIGRIRANPTGFTKLGRISAKFQAKSTNVSEFDQIWTSLPSWLGSTNLAAFGQTWPDAAKLSRISARFVPCSTNVSTPFRGRLGAELWDPSWLYYAPPPPLGTGLRARSCASVSARKLVCPAMAPVVKPDLR